MIESIPSKVRERLTAAKRTGFALGASALFLVGCGGENSEKDHNSTPTPTVTEATTLVPEATELYTVATVAATPPEEVFHCAIDRKEHLPANDPDCIISP